MAAEPPPPYQATAGGGLPSGTVTADVAAQPWWKSGGIAQSKEILKRLDEMEKNQVEILQLLRGSSIDVDTIPRRERRPAAFANTISRRRSAFADTDRVPAFGGGLAGPASFLKGKMWEQTSNVKRPHGGPPPSNKDVVAAVAGHQAMATRRYVYLTNRYLQRFPDRAGDFPGSTPINVRAGMAEDKIPLLRERMVVYRDAHMDLMNKIETFQRTVAEKNTIDDALYNEISTAEVKCNELGFAAHKALNEVLGTPNEPWKFSPSIAIHMTCNGADMPAHIQAWYESGHLLGDDRYWDERHVLCDLPDLLNTAQLLVVEKVMKEATEHAAVNTAPYFAWIATKLGVTDAVAQRIAVWAGKYNSVDRKTETLFQKGLKLSKEYEVAALGKGGFVAIGIPSKKKKKKRSLVEMAVEIATSVKNLVIKPTEWVYWAYGMARTLKVCAGVASLLATAVGYKTINPNAPMLTFVVAGMFELIRFGMAALLFVWTTVCLPLGMFGSAGAGAAVAGAGVNASAVVAGAGAGAVVASAGAAAAASVATNLGMYCTAWELNRFMVGPKDWEWGDRQTVIVENTEFYSEPRERIVFTNFAGIAVEDGGYDDAGAEGGDHDDAVYNEDPDDGTLTTVRRGDGSVPNDGAAPALVPVLPPVRRDNITVKFLNGSGEVVTKTIPNVTAAIGQDPETATPDLWGEIQERMAEYGIPSGNGFVMCLFAVETGRLFDAVRMAYSAGDLGFGYPQWMIEAVFGNFATVTAIDGIAHPRGTGNGTISTEEQLTRIESHGYDGNPLYSMIVSAGWHITDYAMRTRDAARDMAAAAAAASPAAAQVMRVFGPGPGHPLGGYARMQPTGAFVTEDYAEGVLSYFTFRCPGAPFTFSDMNIEMDGILVPLFRGSESILDNAKRMQLFTVQDDESKLYKIKTEGGFFVGWMTGSDYYTLFKTLIAVSFLLPWIDIVSNEDAGTIRLERVEKSRLTFKQDQYIFKASCPDTHAGFSRKNLKEFMEVLKSKPPETEMELRAEADKFLRKAATKHPR